jgi:hypothetical protein
VGSPDKKKGRDRPLVVPQFLEGISNLTEDDMDMLATFEEEQYRKNQTKFD